MHREVSVSTSVICENIQSALTPLNSDRKKKKLWKRWDRGVKELDAGGLAKFERP